MMQRYHWLPRHGDHDTSACRQPITWEPGRTTIDPWRVDSQEMCPDCRDIWHIVGTSVEDARTTIRECESTTALLGAYELAEYVTLRNLLRSRLKKLGEIVPQ